MLIFTDIPPSPDLKNATRGNPVVRPFIGVARIPTATL